MILEKITTLDKNKNVNGWLMPIYKNYDSFFHNYEVKFIYASCVSPKTVKGPHIHLKRECRLVPVVGKARIVMKENDSYQEYYLDSSCPEIIVIKSATPFCVYNDSDSDAVLLNLANHAWKPDDTDNYSYDKWDYVEK